MEEDRTGGMTPSAQLTNKREIACRLPLQVQPPTDGVAVHLTFAEPVLLKCESNRRIIGCVKAVMSAPLTRL